jgi:hypothetical protein
MAFAVFPRHSVVPLSACEGGDLVIPLEYHEGKPALVAVLLGRHALLWTFEAGVDLEFAPADQMVMRLDVDAVLEIDVSSSVPSFAGSSVSPGMIKLSADGTYIAASNAWKGTIRRTVWVNVTNWSKAYQDGQDGVLYRAWRLTMGPAHAGGAPYVLLDFKTAA